MNIIIKNSSEQYGDSYYAKLVLDKINNAMPNGYQNFCSLGRYSNLVTIDVPSHSNDDFTKVFCVLLLIARKYIYFTWGKNPVQIITKSYNGNTWASVWNAIRDIDFNTLTVETK